MIGSQADLFNTEPFDDSHRSAAVRARPDCGLRYGAGDTGLRPRCFGQEFTAASNQWCTASIGEDAEVPDAHEATGEQMQKKAPKKLIGADCHLSLLVAVRIILPSKGDTVILEGQQPVVGDGDPVRVAREVMQYMLRPAKGALGVDDPVLTEQLSEKLRKHPRVCQDFQRAMKLQLIAARQVLEGFSELSPKYLAENADRKKVAGACVNPPRAVWRQAAGWNHAMYVRVS